MAIIYSFCYENVPTKNLNLLYDKFTYLSSDWIDLKLSHKWQDGFKIIDISFWVNVWMIEGHHRDTAVTKWKPPEGSIGPNMGLFLVPTIEC